MNGDSIPTNPKEGGQKQSSDNKAREQHVDHSPKNIRLAKGNKRIKSKSSLSGFDLTFGVLEFFALIVWMLAELFHEHNNFNLYCFCLWVAMACFLAGATHVLHKALGRAKLIWSLFALVCLILLAVAYIYTRSIPMENGDIKSNKDFRLLEAQLQNSMAQLKAVNDELIATRNASLPRIITPEQRNKIIAFLSDAHASKIAVKVIVGNNDSETANFAEQFREMLDAAGYGKNAPKRLAPTDDSIWVTNIIHAAIPSYGNFNNRDIVNLPGVFPQRSSAALQQKCVEVFAVISHTNGTMPRFLPTFMVMKATKANPGGGEVFAYHPTDNPTAIMVGICNALVENGISIGYMPGNGILSAEEAAFFIPQRIY